MTPEEEPGDTVRRKAERLERERGKKAVFWRQLAHVGVLGWVFILPVVALAYAGHLVGRAVGHWWPALAGVLLGVVVGAYLVWRNLRQSLSGP